MSGLCAHHMVVVVVSTKPTVHLHLRKQPLLMKWVTISGCNMMARVTLVTTLNTSWLLLRQATQMLSLVYAGALLSINEIHHESNSTC